MTIQEARTDEKNWGSQHLSLEGQLLDQKSLRAVTGKTADWNEIAKDCIAFANATGGRLLLGIEDGQDAPPASQHIPADLPDTLRRKLADRTVNVTVLPDIVTAPNGGQYIELRIPRALAVASTTDGRYFLRVADQSKPVTGDDVMRLASERSALSWETQTTLHIPRVEAEASKRDKLLQALRASDRVKASVKEKTDEELLDHYQLAQGQALTNLGVLCLGRQHHRAQLTTAPVIQFIKYDEHGQKVNKLVWDDHTQSPMELIEAVWLEVPDFRERYELPDGLYRQNVPAFDEIVVRELLVNALVHRPYTQRGDIFLNLHPDRLEVVNPGPLPLGVTPQNVLQPWLKRLLEWHLVQSAGRTQATRYFVDPGLLRSLKFTGETTLKRIEPHRLAALALEDLQRYPRSAISDIHRRIGGEIHPKQVKRALEELIGCGTVRFEGNNRWRRYWAVS